MIFHQHNWKEIARTYSQPVNNFSGHVSNSVLGRAMFGVTTILWECQECQEIRKEEMLGKQVLEQEDE